MLWNWADPFKRPNLFCDVIFPHLFYPDTSTSIYFFIADGIISALCDNPYLRTNIDKGGNGLLSVNPNNLEIEISKSIP